MLTLIKQIELFNIAGINANYLHVQVLHMEANTSARLSCVFFSGNPESPMQTALANRTLNMTGADYQAWTTDDNYVMTWAIAQLGLTAVNP